MVASSKLAFCAAFAGASAFQIPFLSSPSQASLSIANETKPLVNSSELQDLISGDRLMVRAKKLFEIAKLGEEEYNHPTRVIGSAGKSTHVRSHETRQLTQTRPRRNAFIHL
jgi:aminopeptidase Y